MLRDTRSSKESVPEGFDRVARSYDLLSSMNPGYSKHLLWSAKRLDLEDESQILDLCCGTGLSTAALRAAYPHASITGVDASPGMLAAAREKTELKGISWVLGNAMDPAAAGVRGPFDGIMMAYGIRNVPDPDLCLERLHALLAEGGSLCLHEYSVAGSRWTRFVWNLVTAVIIIPLGLLFTGTTSIFRYLRRSVLEFDSVSELESRLAMAGFVEIRSKPMDGWQRGVVHSFVAKKISS